MPQFHVSKALNTARFIIFQLQQMHYGRIKMRIKRSIHYSCKFLADAEGVVNWYSGRLQGVICVVQERLLPEVISVESFTHFHGPFHTPVTLIPSYIPLMACVVNHMTLCRWLLTSPQLNCQRFALSSPQTLEQSFLSPSEYLIADSMIFLTF